MSPDDLFKRLRKHKPQPPGAPEGAPEPVTPGKPEPSSEGAGKKRPPSRPKPAQTVEQRQRQLAESFLDNEALTENLDDRAAKALIEWSMDLSRRVAESTQDLPPDQAEARVAQGGEAARQLIRAARDLALVSPPDRSAPPTRGLLPAPEETDRATSGSVPGPDLAAEAFARAARHAQEVYGGAPADQAGAPGALRERLRQAGDSPLERIAALRAFLESSAADQDLPFWHGEEKDRDW